MSTVCKDCGVQGKGVHHCEQYHNQAHSIAEYQHIEKELQAKVEELTSDLVRVRGYLDSERKTARESIAMLRTELAALKQEQGETIDDLVERIKPR